MNKVRFNLSLGSYLLLAAIIASTLSAAAQTPVDQTTVLHPSEGSAPSSAQAPSGGILAVLDDFNRADGPIGDAWTVHNGFCNVSSNAAVCGGRATYNGAPGDGSTAEADIAVNGTALQYTGLLLNYGAGVNNLFIKVQQQSPFEGEFTNAACYIGNGESSFGLGFFELSSPFASAHMTVVREGSTVTIEFTNVDGGAQADQTYVCDGAPDPEGTGIGILGYNDLARLDNFGIPEAPLPAITLQKTVGTDPYACAITDEVAVPAGTMVTYCYEVTNTGNVALKFHDLVDDQLGVILNDFPYTLSPAASAFLTQSVVITEAVVNSATWTAWDGDNLAEATDTAAVTILVPSIALQKTVGTDPHVCAATDEVAVTAGTMVTYCYEVTNTGEVALTLHDLVDDQLGVILNDFPYSLAPTASAFLTQSVVVTEDVVNTATWTAWDGANVAEATDTAAVNVLEPSISLLKTVGTEVGVCAATGMITVPSGTTVYYCYTVTNTGDVSLNLHDLEDDQLGNIFSGLDHTLDPGDSFTTVEAGISIPAVILADTVNTGTWTAYNLGGESAQSQASATVDVLLDDTFLPIVLKH